MLSDVLTGWTAETLGGLSVLTAIGVWGRLSRLRAARPDSVPAQLAATAASVRTYTLPGARAADGQPAHLPSSRLG